MLKYLRSLLGKYTAHPILAFVVLLGVGFAVVGFAAEFVTSNGILAGHFLVYAILAVSLGGAGYALFFTARLAKKLRRKAGPA